MKRLTCSAAALCIALFALSFPSVAACAATGEWSLPASGAVREGNVLAFDLAETGTAMASAPIDLSPLAGKCVTARIRTAAENLLPGPRRHLGYKFMISFKDEANGEMMWPGAPCLTGTFDWRESMLELDLRGRKPGPAAYSYLPAVDIKDVIYQVHMYVPTEFTHQGVYGGKPIAYPNADRGWNRETLKTILAPVRDFQRRHDARIYVGEFSAICWAQGADRYIADCISLFEDYGWDWTYHAFREWEGWSVEHEGTCHADLHPSADNPRKRALLEGLRRQ